MRFHSERTLKCNPRVTVAGLVLILVLSGHARADTFGSGDNSFDIDFVTIGNPGNAADTIGIPSAAGAVDYGYRIGKYEISRDMVDKASAEVDLRISMHSMTNVTGGPRPDMPAAGISWNEAARFVNWLNRDAGSAPAYKFEKQPGEEGFSATQGILLWNEDDSGFDADNLFRNSQSKYFLPSVDEWYKAAYYDPDANESTGGYWSYPTGSDTRPTRVMSGTDPETAVYSQPQSQGPADITQAGGLSPYGVMGLGGNVYEWMETESNRFTRSASSWRMIRGNNWFVHGATEGLTSFGERHNLDATWTGSNGVLGFRVASIPESMAGDFDDDGDVDGADFLKWQQGVSPNPMSAEDLDLWEAQYDTTRIVSVASTTVPEPSSFVLLLSVFACSLRRQRRRNLEIKNRRIRRIGHTKNRTHNAEE